MYIHHDQAATHLASSRHMQQTDSFKCTCQHTYSASCWLTYQIQLDETSLSLHSNVHCLKHLCNFSIWQLHILCISIHQRALASYNNKLSCQWQTTWCAALVEISPTGCTTVWIIAFKIVCNERMTLKVVRSFVIAGRGPAYSGPQRWDLYGGPMCQPRERRGIGRCVRCMCELCRVEEELSRREQLVRYF